MAREQFIESLIKRENFTRGAELGVKEGRTLFHLLQTCPLLEMLAVDTWTRFPNNKNEGQETYVSWDMERFEGKVRDLA